MVSLEFGICGIDHCPQFSYDVSKGQEVELCRFVLIVEKR
jgi:hypothetical protein